MQTVVLIIHLLLALALMGVVLLQRSEGGGLGIGGGAMGPQAGRPPLTGLAKLTWLFAGAFIITSLTLTVIAASNSAQTSVLERIGIPTPPAAPEVSLPELPVLPGGGTAPLLPPAGETPALPPVTVAPATETPATDAPATDAPATEAPATEPPATEAPATEAPTQGTAPAGN